MQQTNHQAVQQFRSRVGSATADKVLHKIKEFDETILLNFNISYMPDCVPEIRNYVLHMADFSYLYVQRNYVQRRWIQILDYIILNMFIAWKLNHKVRYSRNSNTYKAYRKQSESMIKKFFAKKPIEYLIDTLRGSKLIYHNLGTYIPEMSKGKQSRMFPKTDIQALFNYYDYSVDWNKIYFTQNLDNNNDVLVIKDHLKNKVTSDIFTDRNVDFGLEPEEDTVQNRKQVFDEIMSNMLEINRYYKDNLDLNVNLQNIETFNECGKLNPDIGLKGYLIKNNKAIHTGYKKLKITDIQMSRVFNDSSLKLGGRIYNIYQNFSKEAKKQFRINNEDVVAIDMKAGQVNMLYHLLEQDYTTHDPYDFGQDNQLLNDLEKKFPGIKKRWRKKVIKPIILTIINAKDIKSGIKAAFKEIRLENGIQIGFEACKKLVYGICKYHKKIKDYFASDAGKLLQNIESNIVINTILRMKREHDVPVLSVHDEIISPKSYQNTVIRILKEEYYRYFGFECELTIG